MSDNSFSYTPDFLKFVDSFGLLADENIEFKEEHFAFRREDSFERSCEIIVEMIEKYSLCRIAQFPPDVQEFINGEIASTEPVCFDDDGDYISCDDDCDDEDYFLDEADVFDEGEWVGQDAASVEVISEDQFEEDENISPLFKHIPRTEWSCLFYMAFDLYTSLLKKHYPSDLWCFESDQLWCHGLVYSKTGDVRQIESITKENSSSEYEFDPPIRSLLAFYKDVFLAGEVGSFSTVDLLHAKGMRLDDWPTFPLFGYLCVDFPMEFFTRYACKGFHNEIVFHSMLLTRLSQHLRWSSDDGLFFGPEHDWLDRLFQVRNLSLKGNAQRREFLNFDPGAFALITRSLNGAHLDNHDVSLSHSDAVWLNKQSHLNEDDRRWLLLMLHFQRQNLSKKNRFSLEKDNSIVSIQLSDEAALSSISKAETFLKALGLKPRHRNYLLSLDERTLFSFLEEIFFSLRDYNPAHLDYVSSDGALDNPALKFVFPMLDPLIRDSSTLPPYEISSLSFIVETSRTLLSTPEINGAALPRMGGMPKVFAIVGELFKTKIYFDLNEGEFERYIPYGLGVGEDNLFRDYFDYIFSESLRLGDVFFNTFRLAKNPATMNGNIEQWHRELAARTLFDEDNHRLPVVMDQFSDGKLTGVFIKDVRGLYDHGAKMLNCVGEFASDCLENATQIVKIHQSTGEEVGTIELQLTKLGKQNFFFKVGQVREINNKVARAEFQRFSLTVAEKASDALNNILEQNPNWFSKLADGNYTIRFHDS